MKLLTLMPQRFWTKLGDIWSMFVALDGLELIPNQLELNQLGLILTNLT